MAVTGNPDEIQRYGDLLKRAPVGEPVLPPEPMLNVDGPLSKEMAAAHDRAAGPAHDFAKLMEQGIGAAGDGLGWIGAHLAEFDGNGAEAITRLLPTQASDNAGDR
jgi:hypothetical protein